MTLPFETLTVFTEPKLGLRGNPSAVIETNDPLDESLMQQVASDLNQPATTFLVTDPMAGVATVRWFAPDAEIGLCGHGTAAAAAFLARKYGHGTFELRGGGQQLRGTADDTHFEIALQAIEVTKEIPVPNLLSRALGIEITALFETDNKHIALAQSHRDVQDMDPDFGLLRELPHFGYAVTAKDDSGQVDFVSRTLVPFVRQLEDHATGSSHAALVPFWAERLGRDVLSALQLSARGGFFHCGNAGNNKVTLSGGYRLLAKGTYYL